MKRSPGSIVRFLLVTIGVTIGCPMPSSAVSYLPAAQHDAKGNLLPLQSYGETIRRGMKFILIDQKTWAKDNKLTDETGATLPPYFLYAVAHGGKLHETGTPSTRIRPILRSIIRCISTRFSAIIGTRAIPRR